MKISEDHDKNIALIVSNLDEYLKLDPVSREKLVDFEEFLKIVAKY